MSNNHGADYWCGKYHELESELSTLREKCEALQRQLESVQGANEIAQRTIAAMQRERDEAAKQEPVRWTEYMANDYGHGELIGKAIPPNLPALIEQARAEEREACAKVCQDLANSAHEFERPNAYQCAKAIRARSKK